MATKKISELEAITEADGSDALVIVDVSEGKTNKITKNNLLQGAGHTIEMSLNENYQIVLKLKNTAGTELSTASIDLPNENSITDISYNNGKLTLTKQSGTTTEVDITGLINGLVTESDFSTFTTQLNQVLQSLNETKADAEDVEALQTRVTDLEQRVEDAENNQLTNTPEIATSHYLQDSADSRFRKFIPIGRTTQESTTGKNLAQVSEIELSGTVNRILCDFGEGRTFEKISFTIIADKATYNNQTSAIFKYINQENTENYISPNTMGITSGSISGTITYTLRNVTIKTITLLNWAVIKGTIKIQIEDGDYTSYEPYTGGEPAPNPNYPYAIKNTGDNVNEFDISQIPSGSVITNNGDGTLTLANNSNNNGYISTQIKFKDLCPNVKVGDTIVVNFNTTSQVANKDRIYISTVNIPIYKNTPIVVTQDILDNNVAFYGGYNETAIISEIKLEKGTAPTPWSPYGCGNVNEKVQNANIWHSDLPILIKTSNTQVIKNNNGGVDITLGSGDTLGYICYDLGKISDYKNKTLTFSIKNEPNSLYRYCSFINCDNNGGNRVELANMGASNNKLTITIGDNYAKSNLAIRLYIYNGTGGTTYSINNIQLEQDSTATDYVPHSEQNISFPLAEGQKFYEGSHPDDDGVHHVMTPVDLSTLTWIDLGDDKYESTTLASKIKKPANNNTLTTTICEKYRPITRMETMQDGRIAVDANSGYIFVKDTTGTPSGIAQYPLAKEEIDPYTEEQKTAWAEWKKARTYKNITHISSEDETPANVEIEYVRDLETVINNLTTRVETIESEV